MADNAAQAIKDLQRNIESLDVSLDKALKSQEKYTQMIAKTRLIKEKSVSTNWSHILASRQTKCQMP